MHNKLLVGLNFQAYIHLQQRLQIFYLHNIKNGFFEITLHNQTKLIIIKEILLTLII